MIKKSLMPLAIAILASCPAIAQSTSTIQAQYDNLSLIQSPTSAITSNFFLEPADQYLSPIWFGDLVAPVFLLKVKTPSGAAVAGDPYEIGMGNWFGKIYGGAYYGFDAANKGNLASDASISQSENDSLILSADNKTVLGKTAVVSETIDYTTYSYNNPIALVGFEIGDIKIGVGDSFLYKDNRRFGSFDPALATRGNTVSTAVTKVIDTAGIVSSLNSTEYALGKKANGSLLEDRLSAGLSMPLGNMALRGGFSFGILSTDDSSSYGMESKVTQAGAGYASFTPSIALAGHSPTAIANAQSWSIDLYDSIDTSMDINPALSASIDIPVDFAGYNATFTPGLNYALLLTTYNAKLLDENGSALAKAAKGSYEHKADYARTENSTTMLMETTTTDTRWYRAYTYTENAAHTIDIPLAFKVAQNQSLNFGVSIDPKLSFGSKAYEVTGKKRVTTTYDNGNGIAAATDPGDLTTVVSTVDQPYSVTEKSLGLSLGFGTGIQIYLKPDKFRVNIGARATTQIINRKETATNYSGLATQTATSTRANETKIDSTTVSTTGDPEFVNAVVDKGVSTSVLYVAGFTYFLNPNVMFDFYAKNPNAFNLGDTSSTGGFLNLNNYTIQMTIKLPPQKTGQEGE